MNDKLRQPAQAALEAMRKVPAECDDEDLDVAIIRLEAALAEPQPEPVAWTPNLNYPDYKKQRVWANGAPKQTDIDYWAKYDGITLAYAAPQAQQPPQTAANSKSRLKRLSTIGAQLCAGCGGKIGNPQPAMARFVDNEPVGEPPLERLRHFCSLAMSPQDWLDVESLFDACEPAEPQHEPVSDEHPYTYASTQATNCAECGKYAHTPLRIDAMGGYVCLTCIDKRLGSLLGEFGYAAPQAEPQPGPLTPEQRARLSPATLRRYDEAQKAAPQALQPLTDEQVTELRAQHGWAKETIRAIEAALGVGGKP